MQQSDMPTIEGQESRHPVSPHPASTLRFVRVSYPDAPDRCTIHPPTRDRIAMMSTWLTANDNAFVDLAQQR